MKNPIRTLALLFLFINFTHFLTAQTTEDDQENPRPKLVVGLVVDQMRWDYLYRYAEKYGNDGFKRLLREGLSCENTHINYFPSYTAVGHTSIYTGSVPAIHGIVGNDWYDRPSKKRIYCVLDNSESIIGTGQIKGNVSPRNLLTTTITDELKLATNFKSKTIAIALKDRSSILPGGHTADAAYMLDGSSGNFVSSSYYMKSLPSWVKDFNAKKMAATYIQQNWSTVLPIARYWESTGDDELFERPYKGESKPVFTHNLKELVKSTPGIISATPFGNNLTLDFAKAAIEAELMGHGAATDFLAVSLSSTDYIGHQFGPNSIEAEDCYIRLDRELASFLKFLDDKVGEDNYLLFLTADHGAAHAADFAKSKKIPAGVLIPDSVKQEVNQALRAELGEGNWVEYFENMQVYLNHALIKEKGISREKIYTIIKDDLMKWQSVANVVDLDNLAASNLQPDLKSIVANGVNPKRCGDIQIIYQPAWLDDFPQGTTHGTVYPYDTHIPLLWYGWNVSQGKTFVPVNMTDIAPTLAALLHIQEPNGSIGKVILPLLER
ncbi:MAG: alkaline phosphatase family protein [Bacteroidetes bacterium]|nr:alkaline phosphatase family protein [Bacteroidota bacterium]